MHFHCAYSNNFLGRSSERLRCVMQEGELMGLVEMVKGEMELVNGGEMMNRL